MPTDEISNENWALIFQIVFLCRLSLAIIIFHFLRCSCCCVIVYFVGGFSLPKICLDFDIPKPAGHYSFFGVFQCSLSRECEASATHIISNYSNNTIFHHVALYQVGDGPTHTNIWLKHIQTLTPSRSLSHAVWRDSSLNDARIAPLSAISMPSWWVIWQ